jgi:hypothetical protein
MLKEMIAIPVFGTISSSEGLNSNSQIEYCLLESWQRRGKCCCSENAMGN